MATLLQDLRYAARMLAKNPGFTLVAVLTLAIGIGGNTLVFSLLEAVLLRPLPYAQPDRLFVLWTAEAKSHRGMNSSYPDFQDWRDQSRTFEAMAAFHEESFNLTGTAEPERVDALGATPGLFELLGIHPVLGRAFTQTDGADVALLGHGLWQREFGNDAGTVGRTVRLDGRAYTVLGILPSGFHFPPRRFGGDPEVFVPLVPNRDRTSWYLQVIGRLRPGATESQARSEMNSIAARLAQAHPDMERGQGILLGQLGQSMVADVRQTTLVLLGAVAFVLLIACANLANLLFAQGAARRREIAIRMAVGASRWRLLRQLLTESLLLAGVGGALGIVLAGWGLPLVASVAPPHTSFSTRFADAGLRLNPTVLAFGLLVSALAAILFGALPAWKSTKTVGISGPRAGRMRGALIAIEVALSFVLLAGAGLMARSLWGLLETDLGFGTERLLTMDVSLPEQKYSSNEQQVAFFGRALERLEGLPGVLSVGATTGLPLTRFWSVNTVEIAGPHPQQGRTAFDAVSPGYFRTMGIPLLSGRSLTNADSGPAPHVGLINRAMAAKYWPSTNPIGQTIVIYAGFYENTPQGPHWGFRRQPLQIVGVVGDVRQVSRDAAPWPELFLPYPQRPSGEVSVVVRTTLQPASLVPAVKKEFWRLDPDLPVTDIKTMNELVEADVAARRFVLLLIGAFAFSAVMMAAVGIYGVASFWVRQRTREIGIRMALGAQGKSIVWLVLSQNAGWLIAGVAAGAVCAAGVTRLLSAYLYTIKPTDSLTFALVGLMQFGLGILASYIPSQRAANVDPTVALRYE